MKAPSGGSPWYEDRSRGVRRACRFVGELVSRSAVLAVFPVSAMVLPVDAWIVGSSRRGSDSSVGD
jgi:hypothetical protein